MLDHIQEEEEVTFEVFIDKPRYVAPLESATFLGNPNEPEIKE